MNCGIFFCFLSMKIHPSISEPTHSPIRCFFSCGCVPFGMWPQCLESTNGCPQRCQKCLPGKSLDFQELGLAKVGRSLQVLKLKDELLLPENGSIAKRGSTKKPNNEPTLPQKKMLANCKTGLRAWTQFCLSQLLSEQ